MFVGNVCILTYNTYSHLSVLIMNVNKSGICVLDHAAEDRQ